MHTLKRFAPGRTHYAQCFVLFINEENGNRGGKKYAQVAAEEHLEGCGMAAMESDAGGFVPRGVRMNALDNGVEMVRSWASTSSPTTCTTSVVAGQVWTSDR